MDINQINQLLGLPSKELEGRVEAKITECLDKLRASGFPDDMPRPQVSYDLKGHTAGQAHGSRLMRLNLDILNDPRYQEDMINDTVPHELAHNVVRHMWPKESSHGLAWKQVMYVLGVEPTRCHTYDTVAARKRAPKEFAYDCGCPSPIMVSKTIHTRIQSGKRYKCRRCGHYLQ